MEFEQIVKRLDWLDKEHRKKKDAISALDERLTAIEAALNAASKQIKALGKQLSEASTNSKRLSQLDEILAKQRADMNATIESLEKKYQRREHEAMKRHQADLEEINKSLAEIRSAASPELTRKFKERADETQRLTLTITDLKQRVEEALRASEEAQRGQKVIDESHKQDLKRMTDIQGELTALRKRVDENREKSILHGDSIRNIDNRLTELLTSEIDRKQAQTAFLEQQTLAQVERDRAWREWRDKYEVFKKQAEDFETQIQNLDETMRSARKAQETYLELNTKLERRINEVTEMQRLAEDRLRQEWITFKADDQKRWTGYSLSSEESFRDLRKDMQKLIERVTALDDATQVMQDQLHQTADTTEQQLQELMNLSHEWMTAYERIMGHGKKTKKAVETKR